MTDWIYESPDGGKTIYRRVLGSQESQRPGHVQVLPDVWFTIEQLMQLGKTAYEHQCLRNEHPALRDIWNEYHTMLSLIKQD